MREVTYSQDVLIEDSRLLAALCVFFERIWLPEMATANLIASSVAAQPLGQAGYALTQASSDHARDGVSDRVARWDERWKELFREGAIQRLSRELDANGFATGQTFGDAQMEELLSFMHLADRLALRHHLYRSENTRMYLFESGEAETTKAMRLAALAEVSAVRSLEQAKERVSAWRDNLQREKPDVGVVQK